MASSRDRTASTPSMRSFRDGVVPTQAHIGEDLSEEKIENLLAALDPSGDGAVDFDEFEQFINRRDKVGISQSREFCGRYAVSFKDQLLKLYDPKKVAPKFHPLYTLKALCKRESLKFDPCIRKHLNVLWKEIDEDKSGRIEYDEYVPMHRRCCEIMVSLTKIEVESISGKKVNVGTGLPPKLLTRDGRINHEEHEKLAQEDWEIDNGGMGADAASLASTRRWRRWRPSCPRHAIAAALARTHTTPPVRHRRDARTGVGARHSPLDTTQASSTTSASRAVGFKLRTSSPTK